MSASDANATSSLSTLLSSPSARNGALALLGSAALLLSYRSLNNSRGEGKESRHERGRQDAKTDREAEEQRRRLAGTGERDEHMPTLRHRSSSAMSELGLGKNSVAIFWDVDNCTPPTGSSGYEVAKSIRRAAQSMTHGKSTSSIVSFKAYLELSTENQATPAAQVNLRSELQGSGVSLIDTPKSGRKDVADKMMITDLLSFAIDKRPPALIVLLSGDRDFAYPLGVLRNRGYEVLLITPPIGAAPILEASANHVMRWRQDVLGVDRDGQGRLYDRPKTTGGSKGARADGAEATTPTKDAAKSTPSSQFQAPQTPQKSNAAATPASTPSLVLKGPGAPPSVPEVFQPLVNLLEKLRKQGNPRPLRSVCSVLLAKTDKTVYERAGANRWADYVAVAEAAGIVILGDNRVPGSEWVALRTIENTKTILKKPSSNNNATNTTAAPPTVTSCAMLPPSTQTTHLQTLLPFVNLQVFFPLIEVCKGLKSNANGGYPIASQVATQIDAMHQSRIKDLGIEQGVYWQAKVKNFTQYLDLAERAGVARLRDYTPSTGGPTQQTVQIHPKSERLYTSAITTSTTPAIANSGKSQNSSNSNNSSNIKDVDKSNAPTKGGSVFMYPHNPSGEKINVDYFPLANLLISQRREGKMSSTEGFVAGLMAKNFRAGQFCNTKEGFAKYLAGAQKDGIITLTSEAGPQEQRFIVLNEWLRDPAEKSDSKESGIGGDADEMVPSEAMTRSASASSKGALTNDSTSKKSKQSTVNVDEPSKTKQTGRGAGAAKAGQEDNEADWVDDDSGNSLDGKGEASSRSVEGKDAEAEGLDDDVMGPQAPLPSIEVKPASKEDRNRFKPLVETLVTLRREASTQSTYDKRRIAEEGTAPLRSRVSAEMVRMHAPLTSSSSSALSQGQPHQPGAWYQSYNVGGFEEYAQQAQEKGFVVLLLDRGSKKRIRLSRKYESMFFSHEMEETKA